jgi:hypothetical protein
LTSGLTATLIWTCQLDSKISTVRSNKRICSRHVVPYFVGMYYTFVCSLLGCLRQESKGSSNVLLSKTCFCAAR